MPPKNRFKVFQMIHSNRGVSEYVLIMSMILLGALSYANTLEAPFVFDDAHNILGNTNIRVSELNTRSLIKAGFGGPLKTRPLAYISFALNYYFNGFAVQGYHAVNITIHLMTGVFLYLFIKILLKRVQAQEFFYKNDRTIAFLSATIWLVHPVQTQSVTYIVQRMNSMAAMFYIMSLFFYVQARDLKADGRALSTSASDKTIANLNNKSHVGVRIRPILLFVLSALAGGMALCSKEIAVTLPVMIFIVEWFFYQGLSRKWVIRQGMVWLGVLIFIVIAGSFFIDSPRFSYQNYNFSLTQRLMTEFRVVATYIGLLLFPNPGRLNLDYDYSISQSLFDPPATIFSLILIVILLYTAIAIAKRQRLISFSILWFVINLVIESSVIPLDIIFEHRLYLPSMTVWLIIILAVFKTSTDKKLLSVLFFAVILLFASWTYERNTVWSDRETLWRDAVSKAPGNSHAHTSLGRALQAKGRVEGALSEFSRAINIDPRNEEAHYRMGQIHLQKGRYSSALEHLKKAAQLDPVFPETHLLLGNTYFRMNDNRLAVQHYSEALKRKASYVDALANRGAALVRLGHFQEAIVDFKKALTINPNHQTAKINLKRTVTILKEKHNDQKALQ